MESDPKELDFNEDHYTTLDDFLPEDEEYYEEEELEDYLYVDDT